MVLVSLPSVILSSSLSQFVSALLVCLLPHLVCCIRCAMLGVSLHIPRIWFRWCSLLCRGLSVVSAFLFVFTVLCHVSELVAVVTLKFRRVLLWAVVESVFVVSEFVDAMDSGDASFFELFCDCALALPYQVFGVH